MAAAFLKPPTICMISALCFCSMFLFASVTAAEPVVINAVGDIMLAGKGTATYENLGYDHPFASVAHELQTADITIGNLEAPITRYGTEFTGKKFRFRTSPKAAEAMQRAGFLVLTLANNHIMDFGAVGLRETLRNLNNASILHTGAGENLNMARKSALVRVGEKRIAFLAYSLTFPPEFYARRHRAGTAPGIGSYFAKDIAKAKSVADHVIVSFHWGAERATGPKPYQITAAYKAINAGADIVIGHHSHVLQGIEFYKGGVIFYSLGNFAFGSTSPSSDISIIARLTLDKGIKEVELIPLNVLNSEIHFQPKVLKGERGLAAIRRLNKLSKPLGTQVLFTGKRYIAVEADAARRLAQD
jgi:poly-gamma-glutamate capsule biosynthesis protein CapA/YwtB (metallophosphatase superfamily)